MYVSYFLEQVTRYPHKGGGVAIGGVKTVYSHYTGSPVLFERRVWGWGTSTVSRKASSVEACGASATSPVSRRG